MALSLAGNGTRVGKMAPRFTRDAKQDERAYVVKHASTRMARHQVREALMEAIADAIAERRDDPDAQLECARCDQYIEYSRWLEEAEALMRAGLPWGVTRKPVQVCIQHQLEAWLLDHADDDVDWGYEDWKECQRELAYEADEVDVLAWGTGAL